MSEQEQQSQQVKGSKNGVSAYFQDSVSELQKVTWPTKNQAIRLTIIVIIFCFLFSIFIGALDFAFNFGYRQLLIFAQQVRPPAAIEDTGSGQNITQQIPLNDLIQSGQVQVNTQQ